MKTTPLINYRYKGHKITVFESERGPFVIDVKGPVLSLHQDTYSLTYLEKAIEENIDAAILKAQKVLGGTRD